MKVNAPQLLKEQIAKYLSISPGGVFLFWKGRVALYAILKAIGIRGGDEIILPAFTCVVAVNPIIYLGARPVYVDIEPVTYNMDVSKIEGKISKKTRAILAQNTFGLAPDLDGIFEVARRYKLKVIEDCAHGFGGSYRGRPNGTIADASFYSSQWNKPFSTGLGGYAIAKDPGVAERLKESEEEFLRPSIKDEMVLKALIFLKERLNSNLYWPVVKTYRWLSKNNLILGSSQGEELEGPAKPKGFEKVFSQTQAKKGMEELVGKEAVSRREYSLGSREYREGHSEVGETVGSKGYGVGNKQRWRIDVVIEHRKRVANLYRTKLAKLGIEPPYEPGYAEHTYLKFPLLVKDRAQFLRAAEKEKIELGDWFLSPIHPIDKNYELWHYRWGESPVAEKISQHIVNLPTHPKIDERYVDKVAVFLKKNRDTIYSSYNELCNSPQRR